MLRTLGALRDPRMWGVVAVGISLRIGFEWGFGRHVEQTLEEREARLSVLSPEDRLDEEVRTLGRISTEVLGVDVEDEVEEAIAEQHRAEAQLRQSLEVASYRPVAGDPSADASAWSPAPPIVGPAPGGLVLGPNGAVVHSPLRVGVHEERGASVPAWAVAGAVGALIAGAGAVISLMLLRGSSEPEPGAVATRGPDRAPDRPTTSTEAPG